MVAEHSNYLQQDLRLYKILQTFILKEANCSKYTYQIMTSHPGFHPCWSSFLQTQKHDIVPQSSKTPREIYMSGNRKTIQPAVRKLQILSSTEITIWRWDLAVCFTSNKQKKTETEQACTQGSIRHENQDGAKDSLSKYPLPRFIFSNEISKLWRFTRLQNGGRITQVTSWTPVPLWV